MHVITIHSDKTWGCSFLLHSYVASTSTNLYDEKSNYVLEFDGHKLQITGDIAAQSVLYVNPSRIIPPYTLQAYQAFL